MKQLQLTNLDAFGETAAFPDQQYETPTIRRLKQKHAEAQKEKQKLAARSRGETANPYDTRRPLPHLGPYQVQTFEGQAYCTVHDVRHGDTEPCILCQQGHRPITTTNKWLRYNSKTDQYDNLLNTQEPEQQTNTFKAIEQLNEVVL